MLRLLADENFNGDIMRALKRRDAHLDIVVSRMWDWAARATRTCWHGLQKMHHFDT
jgi:hypothetical protein